MARPGARLATIASVFALSLYLGYRFKRPMTKRNLTSLCVTHRVLADWDRATHGGEDGRTVCAELHIGCLAMPPPRPRGNLSRLPHFLAGKPSAIRARHQLSE
jgi:hypothetical protein